MEPLSPSPAAYSAAPGYYAPASTNQSPTLSVGDWMVTMLISCIPLVGFIMLLVWAFSSSTPPSKANWAKAALIFALIFMVLSFLFAGSIMAVLMQANTHRTY